MKRILSTAFLCAFFIVGLGNFASAEQSVMTQEETKDAYFSDVGPTHKNFTAIQYLYERKMIQGYQNGTFGPKRTINRAEFTKMLMKAALSYDAAQDPSGYDIYSLSGVGFSDIEDRAWYIPYLRKALSNNVIQGYPDGRFLPANEISFVEAAKIIVKSFGDEVIANEQIWYKPYVDFLASKGAIPMSIRHFDQRITRGEAAEMLYRLVGIVWDKESQTYDSLRMSEPEIARDILKKGLAGWQGVSSFRYSASLTFVDISPSSTDQVFFVQLDGGIDETVQDHPIYVVNFNVAFSDADVQQLASSGQLLVNSEYIFLFLNDLKVAVSPNDFDQYVGQWWELSLPPDVLSDTQDQDLTARIGQRFDVTSILKDLEYLGVSQVLTEDSHGYKAVIDEQAFFDLMTIIADESGEVFSSTDQADLQNFLDNNEVDVELSVAKKSGILNMLAGKIEDTIVGAGMSFTLSFGSFNEPVTFVSPHADAKPFPVEDLILLLQGNML